MNERLLRPTGVAAAAVLIGGALVVAQPRYAVSIAQIVVVTIAAATGLHALAAHVPTTGWMSPFRWMSPFEAPSRTGGRWRLGRRRDDPSDLRSIGAKLSGRRQRVPGGVPLPPEILRTLQPMIRLALHLDPDDAPPASARTTLSPLTWAVLTCAPLERPRWYRTLPPNRRRVAEVVHHVLDELDHRNLGTPEPRLHPTHNPHRS